jgi:ribosome-binding protein aMBF1 (putative translation factor)|tara:strand:+ start:30 stop:293 length:264 start_codon:yes stop_codon:yes gene_type:complete
MAKAKAKSKSSKVAEKVEVLKTPPKPKKQVNPIEEIVSALDEDYNIVLTQARENVGDDLVKLREEVLRLDGMSQSNYAVIIKEIDKY